LALGQSLLSNLFSKKNEVENLYSYKEEFIFVFSNEGIEVLDIQREIWRDFKQWNPIKNFEAIEVDNKIFLIGGVDSQGKNV
jgi:hypothetical protein